MPSSFPPALADGSLSNSAQPTIAVGDIALIRPWKSTDAPAILAAFDDADIRRWHVSRADSLEEARDLITRWQNVWATEAEGNWAIVEPASDALLGRIALKGLDLHDATAEVAYWMCPGARGRGLCTASVEALSQWAFHQIGFHRLHLEHSVHNLASCRVAVKAGFQPEGVRRSAALHADGWHDMHTHARLFDDAIPHVYSGGARRSPYIIEFVMCLISLSL